MRVKAIHESQKIFKFNEQYKEWNFLCTFKQAKIKRNFNQDTISKYVYQYLTKHYLI